MRNGLRKARMLGMMLALFCLASSAFAQTVVKGRVTDGSNNQTLPGVSVAIKGTTQGTITDINGNYFGTLLQGKVCGIQVINSSDSSGSSWIIENIKE